MQHPMENDLRDSNLFFKAQKVEFQMDQDFIKNASRVSHTVIVAATNVLYQNFKLVIIAGDLP